jgi:exodeoxyribonuclease VII large subunit
METLFDTDNRYLSVSEITSQIKFQLEESFQQISVIGEISNFKAHISGHWYFTLKDSNASISCTMWKGLNSYVFFTPQDGMKVIVNGKISVYPPRGSYQIDVRSMKAAGEGELQAAFERLKKKLAAEGLFDDHYKKEIPFMPKKIGVVTAIGGAALRDMINVAERRFPLVELQILPTKVQGEGAAEEIAANINEFNERSEVDLIIVARGGGSLEDLWAFNEEIVARAAFESELPIVSGVGHEVDYTIIDFVADLRAPTPSAAMELSTPDQSEIFAFISDFSYTSASNISDILKEKQNQVRNILRSHGFRLPESLIKNKIQFLDNLIYRIQSHTDSIIKSKKNELRYFHRSIENYNFESTLKRGFAIVKQSDQYIQRAEKLSADKEFRIKFYDKEVKIGSKK